MHELATKAGRYKIDQNIPTRSELSEAEQAELEEFLSNIKILTSALGCKIFEALEETISKPMIKENLTASEVEPHLFYCKNSVGAAALGSPSTEGFVVFKGSIFMPENQPSLPESIRNEKADMIDAGILVKENDRLALTKDYVFNSSSRAAAMILARSATGPGEWKTEDGKTLKQIQS